MRAAAPFPINNQIYGRGDRRRERSPGFNRDMRISMEMLFCLRDAGASRSGPAKLSRSPGAEVVSALAELIAPHASLTTTGDRRGDWQSPGCHIGKCFHIGGVDCAACERDDHGRLPISPTRVPGMSGAGGKFGWAHNRCIC